MRNKDNEIGVILGPKGQGKTTLVRSLLPQMDRVIVLDSLCRDYGGGCVVRRASELVEYWRAVGHYAEFNIIVRPAGPEVVTALFRLCKGVENIWLVIEESDRYMNPHKIHPDFGYLINYARGQNVSMVCVARRAAKLHLDVTNNADWIVSHRCTGSGDLERLSDYMDVSTLPALGQFEWEMSGLSRLNFEPEPEAVAA